MYDYINMGTSTKTEEEEEHKVTIISFCYANYTTTAKNNFWNLFTKRVNNNDKQYEMLTSHNKQNSHMR